MMKKITLLLILLSVSFGYSQTTLIENFDTGIIANTNWNPDQGGTTAVVADPDGTRGLVGQFVTGAGQQWQSAQLLTQGPAMDLSTSEKTVTVEFYYLSDPAGTPNDIFAKVTNGTAANAGAQATHGGNGWETLAFTFNTKLDNQADEAAGIYSQIEFYPHWNSVTGAWNPLANVTILVNEIRVAETCSDGIQNQDETDIDCGGLICAICDIIAPTAFTATVGTIGATTVELLLMATDETSAITYNVTGGATAQTTGASGVETSLIITGLTPETLYSFDVSASDASGNPAANNAITVGATTIAVPVPAVSAPLSTTPDSDVSYLYSDVYTTNQVSFNNPTWAVVGPSNYNDPSSEFVISGTSDNIRYFEDAVTLYMEIPATDFSTYDFFHIDIWSTNSSFVIVKWVGAGPALEGNVAVNLTTDAWTSVDIDLSTFGSFATPANRATMFQLIIDAAGGNDYYFDNIYFSKTAFTLGTEDFNLASFSAYPNPTQDSWTVKTKTENISSIKVFDILGKNVLSIAPNDSEATIDGSSLKAGLYFAQIKTANGISSLKLVKK